MLNSMKVRVVNYMSAFVHVENHDRMDYIIGQKVEVYIQCHVLCITNGRLLDDFMCTDLVKIVSVCI